MVTEVTHLTVRATIIYLTLVIAGFERDDLACAAPHHQRVGVPTPNGQLLTKCGLRRRFAAAPRSGREDFRLMMAAQAGLAL